MDLVKFKQEIETLKKFFELYCQHKHENHKEKTFNLNYKDEDIQITLKLCPRCLETINYSFNRLLECPHHEKPRCRKCPNPCYEKKQWKEIAKIMGYSGMHLGLSRINKKLKNIFSKN